MFIEKISKAKKEEYIENYVNEKNKEEFPFNTLEEMEKEDGAYKKMILDDRDIEFAKNFRYDKFFEELEKQNIFIRFYYNNSEDYCHRYSYQHALIFVFGDNSIKIFDEHIGTRAYFNECCESIKEYLSKNLEKIKISDPLDVNKEYVTTFMAENVENIEEYINHIYNTYEIKKKNYLTQIEREKSKVLSHVMAQAFEK